MLVFAVALLASASHGHSRRQVARKKIESVSSGEYQYRSQWETEQLQAKGPLRALALLSLSISNPAAGWQAAGHSLKLAGTPATRHRRSPAPLLSGTADARSLPLTGLRSLIVGGGPSGLLLAHRLLDGGASVSILEGRPDPRTPGYLEGRAYALGLGLRGRTAIRTVDEELWQAVADNGFPSDRFTLHFGKFKFDLRTPDDSNAEPSVLTYQSELCSAMLSELLRRHSSKNLTVTFESKVISCDPLSGIVKYITDGKECTASADLIAGCDGVNSVVRAGLAEAAPAFQVTKKPLPGNLKVVRLDAMPPPLAPDAVSVVPGSPISAFLEPTPSGACALLTWRDGGAGSDPTELTDAKEAAELLASSLPLIGTVFNRTEVGEQFVRQRPSSAATVLCNCYHVGRAVLLGDAAHSTGGATGQGCNSALQDAAALADLLLNEATAASQVSEDTVSSALRKFSRQRVPEGRALLELSTGPGRASGPLRRAFFALRTVANSFLYRFGLGQPPLQTELTTSLTPFVDIRRKRDAEYGEPFPGAEEFEREMLLVEESARAQ